MQIELRVKIVLQGQRFANMVGHFFSEDRTMVTFFALDKPFWADILVLYPFAVVNLLSATIWTGGARLHAHLCVLYPLTVEHFFPTLATNLCLVQKRSNHLAWGLCFEGIFAAIWALARFSVNSLHLLCAATAVNFITKAVVADDGVEGNRVANLALE